MKWQGTTGTSLVSVRSDGKISEKPQQRKDIKYITAGRRTNTNTELASWSTKPSWALSWVAVQFLVDSSLFDSGQALSTSPSCKCMPQQQAMTITKSKHSTISCKKSGWNAKKGPDYTRRLECKNWKGSIKRLGWHLWRALQHQTNDRGLRLLEFASANDLLLANTFGPHKTSRRMTWHGPNGAGHQIDYIMMKKRFWAWINFARTRSFPGADVGSDHDLVMMTFRVHLRKANKQNETRLKFNLEKLKDPNIHKTFQAMIGGKFAPLTILKDTEEGEDLDTLTRNFSTAITDTAMEILGKHRPKKKKWITDDILEMCDKRRELNNKKHDAQGRSQYRDINNKIRKAIKQAKENWNEEQCEEIDTNLTKNNTKRAYQIVKDLTTTKKGRASTIQDKSGKSLTEDQEILTCWTEYCSDLYNHETQGDCAVLSGPHSTNQDNLPILKEEVKAAVTSLKKRKSAGVDNIPAELVQAGGEAMTDALHISSSKIWQTGKWPTQWTQSLIITLPKNGNLQMCQNYRTISLISHPSKVMLKILLNRLQPQAEEVITEEQAGFCMGRSTTEHFLFKSTDGEIPTTPTRPIPCLHRF